MVIERIKTFDTTLPLSYAMLASIIQSNNQIDLMLVAPKSYIPNNPVKFNIQPLISLQHNHQLQI